MIPMFRINGIGFTFSGVSHPDDKGHCTATQWFTFVFLPIFPVARYLVKPLGRAPFRFQFQTLAKEKLVLNEVLQTYLYGWILFPLLLLGPALFLGFAATPEAEKAFNLPEWSQMPLIVLSILWLGVSVWKLQDWNENRWFRKP
jgi:hypothetical protein